MKAKLSNWEYLQRFFRKHSIPVTDSMINEVVHNKPGAGLVLIETVYAILNNKPYGILKWH